MIEEPQLDPGALEDADVVDWLCRLQQSQQVEDTVQRSDFIFRRDGQESAPACRDAPNQVAFPPGSREIALPSQSSNRRGVLRSADYEGRVPDIVARSDWPAEQPRRRVREFLAEDFGCGGGSFGDEARELEPIALDNRTRRSVPQPEPVTVLRSGRLRQRVSGQPGGSPREVPSRHSRKARPDK